MATLLLALYERSTLTTLCPSAEAEAIGLNFSIGTPFMFRRYADPLSVPTRTCFPSPDTFRETIGLLAWYDQRLRYLGALSKSRLKRRHDRQQSQQEDHDQRRQT